MTPCVWFELPIYNPEKALPFYRDVFDWRLDRFTQAPEESRQELWHIYGADKKAIGGLYVSHKKRGKVGVELYLSVPSITQVLNKVIQHGGKTDLPKTKISDELGYYARFVDTEGNIIGVWSQK